MKTQAILTLILVAALCGCATPSWKHGSAEKVVTVLNEGDSARLAAMYINIKSPEHPERVERHVEWARNTFGDLTLAPTRGALDESRHEQHWRFGYDITAGTWKEVHCLRSEKVGRCVLTIEHQGGSERITWLGISYRERAQRPPPNATEKRLNKIVIDVCFRGANLSDCLKVLQGHIDKQASEDNRVAPRFVCDLEMPQFLLDRTDPGPHAHRYPPLATFEAKDISVFEAMNILSELCEVQFASTPKQIIVEQVEEETANQ
jgi:hypothetical protein